MSPLLHQECHPKMHKAESQLKWVLQFVPCTLHWVLGSTHNFQVHSHSLPGAGKDTPRPGAAAVLDPGPPTVLIWAREGPPQTAANPTSLRLLLPFLLPEHQHLLQLCSPSQVMSGQAAECKSTQNSLLHQASFGEPVASCSRLCSP